MATLLGLGLSSGGASALNHYFDRDIDALMARTAMRPSAGRVASAESPRSASASGCWPARCAMLAVDVNVLTAGLALAGALFYVIVYTVWLKRRTPQNIVIGGAAGAVPPLVGWAAVDRPRQPARDLHCSRSSSTGRRPTSGRSSLLAKDDYARAGIPMLPVVRGERETARQILLYTLLLVALTLLPLRPARSATSTPPPRSAGRRLPVAGGAAAARHVPRPRPPRVPLLSGSTWPCCSPRSASTGSGSRRQDGLLDKQTANANIVLASSWRFLALLFVATIMIGLLVSDG